jgi:hypothetical protein
VLKDAAPAEIHGWCDCARSLIQNPVTCAVEREWMAA